MPYLKGNRLKIRKAKTYRFSSKKTASLSKGCVKNSNCILINAVVPASVHDQSDDIITLIV